MSLEALKPKVVKPVQKDSKEQKKVTTKKVEKPVEVKTPEPVVTEYTVQDGDTLTSIAQSHAVDVLRVWQKNTNISNQDSLTVGDRLTIPNPDEILPERPFIAPLAAPTPSQVVEPISAPIVAHRASGGPNGYVPGYCTWYVKERRPDIGGYWGNARQWVASAQANGYATGSEPRVGAIGVSFSGYYGHVVYVESVSVDSIVISDMNGVAGFNAIGSRTASSSEFTYIY